MANLKDLRNRITSVQSTRQITSAMKMVAAAKLRKAQEAIVRLRPYANKLEEILSNLSAGMESMEENSYTDIRELRNVLIVVFTSNRGLCGAFNSNSVKKAISLAEEQYTSQLENDRVSFIAVGKKAADVLKKKKYNLLNSYTEIYDQLTFENVIPIAETIMNYFTDKRFDKVELVYNQFKSAGVQVLTEEQFLPIKPDEEEEGSMKHDYIFEPSKEFIVSELIPKSLKIQFYKALLDSNASEQGARMTAMHMATENATELIRELRLYYNKARQAAITNEILEIVSGAEALKG